MCTYAHRVHILVEQNRAVACLRLQRSKKAEMHMLGQRLFVLCSRRAPLPSHPLCSLADKDKLKDELLQQMQKREDDKDKHMQQMQKRVDDKDKHMQERLDDKDKEREQLQKRLDDKDKEREQLQKQLQKRLDDKDKHMREQLQKRELLMNELLNSMREQLHESEMKGAHALALRTAMLANRVVIDAGLRSKYGAQTTFTARFD